MPWRQWTSGQLVTQPDFQSYVQDQANLQFASAAARTAAIPTPTEGMLSNLTDTPGTVWMYTGGQWVAAAGKMAACFIPLTSMAVLPANTWTDVPFSASGITNRFFTFDGSNRPILPWAMSVAIAAALKITNGATAAALTVRLTLNGAPWQDGIAQYGSASYQYGAVINVPAGLAKNDVVGLQVRTSDTTSTPNGGQIFLTQIGL